MKITRSRLKELIRQSIEEIDFKSQAAFDAYNKKHKMRKSTKVNVAGKDTTAGDAEQKPRAATPATDKDNKRPTKNPFSKESPAHEPWEKKHGKGKDLDPEKPKDKFHVLGSAMLLIPFPL